MPKVKKKRWWCGWEEQAAGEVEQRPQLVEEEEDSGWVQWLRSRDYGRTTFVILMEGRLAIARPCHLQGRSASARASSQGAAPARSQAAGVVAYDHDRLQLGAHKGGQ
ncbi:hypothetical protein BHM03_00056138 [Ensete ventricosum]|nr:hypothetical protein BHM03_00056138 [Ensete ventricosum]